MKSTFWRGGKKWLMIVPVVIVISVGFYSLQDKEFEIVKNAEIFYSVFNEVERFYVDDTQPEELFQSAIEGMLSSLDPYTVYIPEEEMDEFTFMTTGEYGGIGAMIRKAGDYTIVAEPYEGFPAQQAGLQAGDTILTIDGISTGGKEISTVSEMLKGRPNTSLQVQLKRIGINDPIERTITRRTITVPNVTYYGMVEPGIGYIRLESFTRDAGKESRMALEELKKMGARSIILDIRDNPGGLLVESVNVSNLFIDRGQEIVSTRGKLQQWDGVYRTTESPVDTDIRLAVLVSRASASASEIVAGALQDLDRAVIVGQRTFGKGLVQTTRPLNYNAQLKVTTAKYYIPSGRCIQALDYSHRNEDGSVGYVPDSLIREYETLNGRKVFDGGGITPDIQVESEYLGNITVSLLAKNLVFDYATVYVSEHDSPGSPESFSLTDHEYEGFLEFLKDKDYDYTTQSDNMLLELIETAKQEKYYSNATGEFDALKAKLAHDKEKDLLTFKDEIREYLEQEIVSRYYYQKGRIQSALKVDKEVARAIELLNNPEAYAALLQGPGNEIKGGLAISQQD